MSSEDDATTEPEEPEDTVEKPADELVATTFDADTINYVQNQLPSTLTIDTAIFGIDNQVERRRVRATGRVLESDIADATTAFEPPECQAQAESHLEKDNAVVLVGPAGIGKRTAALVLLRAMTKATLILLSPQITLTELAERKFDDGVGYAVIDHIVKHSADSEFAWRVIRERLAEAQSYLVVTTTTEPFTTDSVRCVSWVRPNLQQVLRRRMSAPLPADAQSTLNDVLDGATRIRDVVELANRLDVGESPMTAVDHFDQTARQAVYDWFEQKPSRRKVTEVTTLAFALGTNDRVFESRLMTLEQRLAEHMPEPESTEDVPSEISLPQDRHLRTEPGSLIVRRTVSSDLGPRSELVFASPGYHRHVLRLLGERMDARFWDAVRAWLDEIVNAEGWRVALGLARLAEVAFDEVLALLEPWSAGSRRLGGQRASVLVVGTMALDDELAPAALQIATRWINSRDAAQRWTAAVAFGGDLGVRYPHEATNRLWQLCTQVHTASGNASLALAGLFATLVRKTPDAGIVLSLLTTKLDRFGRAGGNVTMHAVAVAATLAVLAARDKVSGRMSFLLYLERLPDRIDTIAHLWSDVLRNRPTRLRGITALQEALKDLADYDERPTDQARRFGTALAAVLTDADRDELQLDMRRVADRQHGIGSDALAGLLSALLNALGRREPTDEEP